MRLQSREDSSSRRKKSSRVKLAYDLIMPRLLLINQPYSFRSVWNSSCALTHVYLVVRFNGRLLRYRIAPQGLPTSALYWPIHLASGLNKLVGEDLKKFAKVYEDDILIFGGSCQDAFMRFFSVIISTYRDSILASTKLRTNRGDKRRGISGNLFVLSVLSKSLKGYGFDSCSYRTHSCLTKFQPLLKPQRVHITRPCVLRTLAYFSTLASAALSARRHCSRHGLCRLCHSKFVP